MRVLLSFFVTLVAVSSAHGAQSSELRISCSLYSNGQTSSFENVTLVEQVVNGYAVSARPVAAYDKSFIKIVITNLQTKVASSATGLIGASVNLDVSRESDTEFQQTRIDCRSAR